MLTARTFIVSLCVALAGALTVVGNVASAASISGGLSRGYVAEHDIALIDDALATIKIVCTASIPPRCRIER